MDSSTAVRTQPLKGSFGLEISGLDVTKASREEINQVIRAVNANGVVVVRDQQLSPQQQVDFTKLFGAPADNPRKEYVLPGQPDIFVISNKIVEGRRIGDADAGTGWHFDMSYDRRPGLCTILYALEVPPEGSNTLFSDLCAAWDALPPSRQAELRDLRIHHSFVSLALMKGNVLTQHQRDTLPDVFHPMVRQHPIDGRLALRPCYGGTNGVVGMENPAGLEMLKELVAYVTEDRFVYSHKWHQGDLVIWDNNCTLHRGTPFDKEKYIRLIHRTWVQSPPEHYAA
jgi:taurine dioxygenase